MNWVLIIVLAIIIINGLVGLKKGLIKMLFSLVSMILVIVATSIFAPQVSTYLQENTTLSDKIQESTQEFFEKNDVLKGDNVEIDLDDVSIPMVMQNSVEDNVDTYVDGTISKYNDYVIESVSNMIFSAFVYIGVLIVLMLVVGIIGIQLKLISKLPVLKQVNGLAGGAVGIIIGLLVVWIFFIGVTMFSNFAFSIAILDEIQNSKILTFIYDKNLLIQLYLNFIY